MTDIRADLSVPLTFDSRELLDTPWACLSLWRDVSCTEAEKQNMGRYLLAGGLMIFDEAARPARGPELYRAFVAELLASQRHNWGGSWVWEQLPSQHELFHCFFDFEDGPPRKGPPMYQEPRVWAVIIGERVICLFTSEWYERSWSLARNVIEGRDFDPKYTGSFTRDVICLRFGINTIVFALTQEGSIADRVMDSFRGY